MRRARHGIVALALAAAGCQEPTSDAGREAVIAPALDLTGRTCGAGGNTGDTFNRKWPCGQRLQLSFVGWDSAAHRAAINQASQNWNEELAAAQLNLPRFESGPGNVVVDVFRGQDEGTSGWCGQSSKVPPFDVTLYRGPISKCGTNTLGAVALQELSHVLGFTDKWDQAVGEDEYIGHCAGRSYNGVVTGTICQHEIETMYRAYGIRTQAVPYDRHLITALTGLRDHTLSFGGSAVLEVSELRFGRSNGTLCGRPVRQTCDGEVAVTSANVGIDWREVAGAPLITLAESGPRATVTAGNAEGQAVVQAVATSGEYGIAAVLGDDGAGTKARITIAAVPPAAAPQSLTAANVSATSAQVRWVNGDASPGTTTVVQYRMTGLAGWLPAPGSPLAAGVSSVTVGGLHCATSYDVNVFHVKNGKSSPWLTLTLFTTAACQVSGGLAAPAGFSERSCRLSSGEGKTYATYTLGWSSGANPGSTIYHIGSSLNNNPGGAAIIRAGAITQTSRSVGPYLVTSSASPRYFWVRHANGSQASAWATLAGNPIEINQGCTL
jgi:Fibronectin type III domain